MPNRRSIRFAYRSAARSDIGQFATNQRLNPISADPRRHSNFYQYLHRNTPGTPPNPSVSPEAPGCTSLPRECPAEALRLSPQRSSPSVIPSWKAYTGTPALTVLPDRRPGARTQRPRFPQRLTFPEIGTPTRRHAVPPGLFGQSMMCSPFLHPHLGQRAISATSRNH